MKIQEINGVAPNMLVTLWLKDNKVQIPIGELYKDWGKEFNHNSYIRFLDGTNCFVEDYKEKGLDKKGWVKITDIRKYRGRQECYLLKTNNRQVVLTLDTELYAKDGEDKVKIIKAKDITRDSRIIIYNQDINQYCCDFHPSLEKTYKYEVYYLRITGSNQTIFNQNLNWIANDFVIHMKGF